MSSAIYPDPPRLVTAVCGHGEQQRLSNARLRLTFYNAPVAYCGPARPGSAFQQSAVSGLLPRARARRGRQSDGLLIRNSESVVRLPSLRIPGFFLSLNMV